MGGEDLFEGPVHAQTFAAPFWIDRTEVTRGQYALCVAAGACAEPVAHDFSPRGPPPGNPVPWRPARDYSRGAGCACRPRPSGSTRRAGRRAGSTRGDEWAEERAVSSAIPGT
jgi:formylglycine-generating enzyme required for sulfatase activity